ncbi:hypothetical protein SAMN04488040_1547 [Sulfitobacter marinus]|uniref:Uncharacterized protein n=1 Tax=Sulfitobacter marinus TaxID=394264 RepID=A0A1I6RV52_9RHOB|nr:hypothetical protein SAMN04488040_1547 [Sulfitobacter marinus]
MVIVSGPAELHLMRGRGGLAREKFSFCLFYMHFLIFEGSKVTQSMLNRWG